MVLHNFFQPSTFLKLGYSPGYLCFSNELFNIYGIILTWFSKNIFITVMTIIVAVTVLWILYVRTIGHSEYTVPVLLTGPKFHSKIPSFSEVCVHGGDSSTTWIWGQRVAGYWGWHEHCTRHKKLFMRVGRDHVFLFCLLWHSIIKCDSYFLTKCNKAYFCYETRRYIVLESKVRMGFASKDCNYSTKMKKVFDSLKKEKSQLYLKKVVVQKETNIH